MTSTMTRCTALTLLYISAYVIEYNMCHLPRMFSIKANLKGNDFVKARDLLTNNMIDKSGIIYIYSK